MKTYPKAKITGQIGSWFVDTPFGELPIVHAHYWERGSMTWRHPAKDWDNWETEARRGMMTRNFDKWRESLKTSALVVVAFAKVTMGENGAPMKFEREGYSGVFSIANFNEEANGDWTFDFVARVANAA